MSQSVLSVHASSTSCAEGLIPCYRPRQLYALFCIMPRSSLHVHPEPHVDWRMCGKLGGRGRGCGGKLATVLRRVPVPSREFSGWKASSAMMHISKAQIQRLVVGSCTIFRLRKPSINPDFQKARRDAHVLCSPISTSSSGAQQHIGAGFVAGVVDRVLRLNRQFSS